ncbi:hypothetical protein SBA1_500028 [Candidatus Sulfotelmatobacter kueseliae]|uniref:Uncharacterized protein n=1 Tax=Candidatus Sulfotelmatobacter kueseliae TaxID=2042962 RepID=A0A2U3KWA2_9BACT|nr:hypothetical protein SBA1_500028 [Candidatus Sulfotelmatobacter kueseliae]
MVAAVSHGHGFGETLGFVVDRTRADGIDMAPIGFFLRMLQRIAVALGSGRHQIFRAVLAGQVESVKSSKGTDFQRRNAVNAVVDGAGRAGKVEDEVNLAHVEGIANILFDELKARLLAQMFEVGETAGDKVVDDNHTPALCEQGITQVGAQKPGAPGDYSALAFGHALLPFLKPFFSMAAGTPSG